MCSQSPRQREGGGDKHMLLCQVYRCPGRGPTLAPSRLHPTTPAPPESWGKGQRYHQGEAAFFTFLALSPEPRFLQRALHLGKGHRRHLSRAMESRARKQGDPSADFQFSFPDGGCWGHISAGRVNGSTKTHYYRVSHSYLISQRQETRKPVHQG